MDEHPKHGGGRDRALLEERIEAGEFDAALRPDSAQEQAVQGPRAMFMLLAESVATSVDPGTRWPEYVEELWAFVDAAFGLTPADGEAQVWQVVLERLIEDAQGDGDGSPASAGAVMTPLHISRDLADLLAPAAAHRGQPVSALVEAALRRYLAEDPPARPQGNATP